MKTSVITRYSTHVREEDGEMVVDDIRFPVGRLALKLFAVLENPALWEAVTAMKRLPEQERTQLVQESEHA